MYDELTIQLGTNDNLYVIDPSTVRVTMGNVEQQNVYDEETDTIHIAVVTGDVEIEADAMTYYNANNALAFNLDCKNVGSNAGFWTDLIGGIKFKLTDVTMADSGAVFNGSTSKAVVMDDNDPTQEAIGTKYLDVAQTAGTLEVIAVANILPSVSNRNIYAPLFMNPKDGGIISLFIMPPTSVNYKDVLLMKTKCSSSGDYNEYYAFSYNGTYQGTTVNGGNNIAVSFNTNVNGGDLVRLNGVTQNVVWFDTWVGSPSKTKFSVGYWYGVAGGVEGEKGFFNGKIMAIRVYSTKLTEQQMIQNYKVDKKRFNLQ